MTSKLRNFRRELDFLRLVHCHCLLRKLPTTPNFPKHHLPESGSIEKSEIHLKLGMIDTNMNTKNRSKHHCFIYCFHVAFASHNTSNWVAAQLPSNGPNGFGHFLSQHSIQHLGARPRRRKKWELKAQHHNQYRKIPKQKMYIQKSDQK